MKGIDFIKKINDTTKVQISEEALNALAAIELPDEFDAKFSEIFISRERAKNDSDIINAVVKEDRKKNFNIFDKKIETFFPFILKEDSEVIGTEFETFKKMDMLREAMEKAQRANKGKVSEDVQKIQDELVQKLKDQAEAHKKELIDREKKFQDLQFEYVIKDKLKAYNISDSFKHISDTLATLAITDLKAKPFQFKLEEGTIAIYKETENGTPVRVYKDGTEDKLTIENLLDKFVEPFTAKSQGGQGGAPPKDDKQKQTPPAAKDKPVSLQDRMRQAVDAA